MLFQRNLVFRTVLFSITFLFVLFAAGAIYYPHIAIGEMGIFGYGFPGMTKSDPPVFGSEEHLKLQVPQVLPLKKITLAKAKNLGSYGSTVATQLEIFKAAAETHYLGLITSASNLTEAQKKTIRAYVKKAGKKLSASFKKVATSAATLANNDKGMVEFATLTKKILEKPYSLAGKAKKIKGRYFGLPFKGKVIANADKAEAVYQINSYIGFLIHFLSNVNSSGALINQLKAISTSAQGTYLEKLRTSLNVVFVSAIKDLTKQSTKMFTRLYKGKTKKAKDFDLMNAIADGDNTFALFSDNISAGSSRSPNLTFNLDRSTNTMIVGLENVRGGPIAFTAVYNPDVSPATLNFSNASATFVTEFATLASIVMGQFTLNTNLSTKSKLETNNIIIGADVTIVAGQADFSVAFTISKKGFISGTFDLNLPGLPEGFPMDVTFIGYITNSGVMEMVQLIAFPTSLGTGGHSELIYSRTP